MVLGGGVAELFGGGGVLLLGTGVVAAGSLAGGLADSSGMFVGARLVQGAGAALMLPAALSTLTTTFTAGRDRNRALGVWGAVAGLSSAVGILLGGALVEGPGWRWVMFVNPIACAVIAPAVLAVLPADRPAAASSRFHVAGTVLVTGGMRLPLFPPLRAPIHALGSPPT